MYPFLYSGASIGLLSILSSLLFGFNSPNIILNNEVFPEPLLP